ncbi:cilia- and flagella-associated protein 251-like [Scylla paramamosain]|uniref:cilia- and flagella-associated protein 251-like n=1 Tax=Scylla paramamosain TaxID=85552 RepID=UPI00308350E5
MNEGQDEASSQDQQLDQLQQELHAKELLLETLRYENNNLKQYSDRHYDSTSTPDWKSYDALKRKVVEYQKALEQRDHIIGQMEAGIKQLMHKNVEAEAKGRKAEEHYSGEIQTLAQQVQELTAQLTITSHQHQAAMKAAQDHFSQQLAASQKQMRDQHGREMATLREKHASEMTGVTLQVEALEKSHREEHHKLVEHLTHLSNSLGAQLEEEKGKVLGLQREKEEWEVHKKELEAESEERESLRKSLNEHITAREDLQDQLRKHSERQVEEKRKRESLHNMSESLSNDLKAENEKRKIMEAKLEEEMKNARKWFEEKTALEVNQKQLVLQLQVAEEELAKAAASRVNNIEKLESFGQENEVLIKDKEALSKENNNLTSEKELLEREKREIDIRKPIINQRKGVLNLK